MLKLGVLASHQGTNFQAVANACEAGELQAKIALLVSNNSGAGALARARKAGIASLHLSALTHPDPAKLDAALCDALQKAEVDLVVLAGYMKKLGPQLLAAYQRRIINVHPSLLPKHGGQGMYGMRVHEAVLQAGERQSGVTVHFVDSDYDTGDIILQAEVEVAANDTAQTLAAKIRPLEHGTLLAAIKQLQETAAT
ncbi:MAG: phosphoribosylglycinamide formyltransferase [Pseudomonadales bacterium]